MNDASKKLEKLLDEQKLLRDKISGVDAEVRRVRVELAADSARQLIKSTGKLAKLFISGALARQFKEVCDCVEVLRDNDPNFMKELASSAYGMDLSADEKFYVQYIFAVFDKPDVSLLRLLDRICSSRNVDSNPFLQGGEK